jgi:hypothetical protein
MIKRTNQMRIWKWRRRGRISLSCSPNGAVAPKPKVGATAPTLGNVYIISNIGSFGEEVLKIGMTRRKEAMDRIWELSDASVPFDFDVHAMIYSEDGPTLERLLHDAFDDLRINKVNGRKEFFRLPIGRIKDFVAAKGLNAAFSLEAEAREYRETKALEKMTPAEREKYHLRRLTDDGLSAE